MRENKAEACGVTTDEIVRVAHSHDEAQNRRICTDNRSYLAHI